MAKFWTAARRRAAARGGKLALHAAGWAFVFVILAPVALGLLYRFVGPPGTLTMATRALDGVEVTRDWVGLKEISPHLVRAVIAAEDARFCQHKGIDFEAIGKAVDERKRGKRRRGASTITQQTAKNVFLWQGGGFLRKGLEAWFALAGETVWGKRRTMEIYLNVAEWGDGYFGAEAAAQGRFGKAAKDLTKHEAALLAAVLPSPNKWRAVNPGPYVRKRAATIRTRMDQVRRDGLDQCVLKKDK
jgi:monofunctional biosynthetic peptidoglycan transglycosylase